MIPVPASLSEKLQEIQARADKATKGPWRQGPYYKADVDSPSGTIRANCWNVPQAIADAEFIAHAREDIPYLLDLLASCAAERPTRTEMEQKATAWLSVGGFFNADLMPAQQTTKLVLEMRDALAALTAERDQWKAVAYAHGDDAQALAARVVELEAQLASLTAARDRATETP